MWHLGAWFSGKQDRDGLRALLRVFSSLNDCMILTKTVFVHLFYDIL